MTRRAPPSESSRFSGNFETIILRTAPETLNRTYIKYEVSERLGVAVIKNIFSSESCLCSHHQNTSRVPGAKGARYLPSAIMTGIRRVSCVELCVGCGPCSISRTSVLVLTVAILCRVLVVPGTIEYAKWKHSPCRTWYTF